MRLQHLSLGNISHKEFYVETWKVQKESVWAISGCPFDLVNVTLKFTYSSVLSPVHTAVITHNHSEETTFQEIWHLLFPEEMCLEKNLQIKNQMHQAIASDITDFNLTTTCFTYFTVNECPSLPQEAARRLARQTVIYWNKFKLCRRG